MGAMNAEIKQKKWLWGGIALQLCVGYTLGYLVYTVGTLIVAPETLAVIPAVGGGIFVALFAAVLAYLCAHADTSVKEAYALR